MAASVDSVAPVPDAVSRRSRRRGRRRRRQDKPALAARLVLDDHVRGDVGILSEDLFADLFPHLHQTEQQQQRDDADAEIHTDSDSGYGPSPLSRGAPTSSANAFSNHPIIHHVAIAPWAPRCSPETTDWTVVSVVKSSALAHSTVQFSPSSLALQNFAAVLQHVAPSKFAGQSRRGIEILILDVEAVALETVFVNVESDLVKRLEHGEGTFFREHPTAPALHAARAKAKGTAGGAASEPSAEDRLTAALRVALSTLHIVHSGDLFPLPLPPHPITHVPPNPGKVLFCEPVAQGILSSRTNIILSRGRLPSKHRRGGDLAPIPPNGKLNGVSEEDGDDTANDQFYSAAEERTRTETDALTEDSEATESELDLSPSGREYDDDDDDDDDNDGLDDGEISDDSMDELISLQAPTLPATLASGVSTVQPGSPMTIGRGRKTTNGISTPGSVFSNYTATTARPDRPRGRLFKAQGLAAPIPSELLHPKPGSEDDEEARVYVDVNNLTRIGCFSGDWVRLEEADEPPANGFGRFALGSFGEPDSYEGEPDWRPVRVFGLPEGYVQRPVTRIPSSKHEESRRLSFFESQIRRPTSPIAYASPLLLANMKSTPYLRLSPLRAAQSSVSSSLPRHNRAPTKPGIHAQPPFAQKVIIQQVRTPVPIEKSVQAAVVAGLKWHFEKKLRVVKAGDFIAIPIDAQLGRTMNDMLLSSEDTAVGDILSLTGGIKEPVGDNSNNNNKSNGSNSNRDSTPIVVGGGTLAGAPSLKADEVAWFKITHVQPQPQPPAAHYQLHRHVAGDDHQEQENVWGQSVACVDIATAHLEQSGTTTARIPGTRNSNWPYYLGLRKAPRRFGDQAASAVVDPDRDRIAPLRQQLRDLLAAATSRRALHLKMPPVAILLVSTQRSIGKATLATNACADIGLHTFAVDAYDILNEAGAGGRDAKTESVLKARAGLAMSCGPACCAFLIRHMEALTADRMVSSMKEILADVRVLIATTTEADKIPDGVRSLFTHEMEVHAPDETERASILRNVVNDRAILLDPEVDLSSVALKTAALVAGDLVDVVERALVCRRSRLENLVAEQSQALSASAGDDRATGITLRDVQIAGGAAVRGLTKADLDAAVDAARKNFADAIGAPKIPNVTWDDVGGLDNVKDVVTETIQLPLERPELFAKGMKKRSGILFYGPPGTGKTLLAKAIATEYSLNFFSVKGPELLNMYIGESEANVRRVFQRARDARPCVVFFDELDSVAPKRGNQGDSGGVMDRIVSQLLAELDGMSGGGGDDDDENGAGSGGVFVIGATNRPDLLDQALLRPGRFDTMLYLGVSDTHNKQLRILEALTRKFTLHPTVSLRAIAAQLPFTYTGADFYALCSDAMLKAVTRQASLVDAKIAAMSAASGAKPMTTAHYFDHYATPEDVAVMVTEQDFLDAHRELVPSISSGELAHYERVRATFEGSRQKQTQQQQQQQQQVTDGATVSVAPPSSSAASSAASSTARPPRKAGRGAMGKGKGKASSLRFSDVEEEDEDDEDDEDEDVGTKGAASNGQTVKGKDKAVSASLFEDQRASDDEDLYD
ncbi:ATPase, AAA-type, core [Niveomyces insectorum RCEF 264]|uniref:Peroxisomal ATPase PEX6 n=1 Tax=Niveomyces insectorum RCEF 264 TaxID=1081102 RepID=A0A167TXJ8_9HYPO|nr:ATPase, AAA-type, core [Niveomyces insectorum RCEF 264]